LGWDNDFLEGLKKIKIKIETSVFEAETWFYWGLM
jgi:hypothetical protein